MTSAFKIYDLEIIESVNEKQINSSSINKNTVINLLTTEIINLSNLNISPTNQLSFVVNNILVNEALNEIALSDNVKTIIGYTSTTYAQVTTPTPLVYLYFFYKTPNQPYLQFDDPANQENSIIIPKNKYISKISFNKYSSEQPNFVYPQDGVCTSIMSSYPVQGQLPSFNYELYIQDGPNYPAYFTAFNGEGTTGVLTNQSVSPPVQENTLPDEGYVFLYTNGFTKETGTPTQVMITIEYYE